MGAPTYSITSGPGAINEFTGKVDWVPSTVGDYSMTITASNGVGSDANQNLTIHVLQEPSLPADLVSYWRFDEDKSSGPFIDEYNVNNGYTENSLTSVTGQANGAYTFNGTDKINIPDQSDFDFQSGNSFTVEAWVKISGGSGDRAAVGKYGRRITINPENYWWLGVNGSNQPTFLVHFAGSGDIQVTSTPISTGTWVHLVGIKNGLTNIQIYVDGVSKGTQPTGSGLNDVFKSYRPLNIGHLYNDKLFDGSIDEVAIYNGVLSATTIANQRSRGMTFHEGYYDIHSSITAFLQGSYSGGTMSTALNGILPHTQPYNTAPWNYYGGEKVASIPNSDIVDWVLLELRSLYNGSAVARRAAFINKYGEIVDLDGTSHVDFVGISSGDYYIIIKHRNHLAIMSHNPVSLPNSSAYDFTTNESTDADKYYGTTAGAVELGTGTHIWGMVAGDCNESGYVTAADITPIAQNLDLHEYLNSDVNLSGYTTAADIAPIASNLDYHTQVPSP